MKKLLIVLAVFSAFAQCAGAEWQPFDTANSTDFRGLENGSKYNAGKNDEQTSTSPCYWMRPEGVDVIVGNIQTNTDRNANELRFDSDRFYRTAAASYDGTNQAYSIDSVYCDAMVRFSPCDYMSNGAELLGEGDKVLVWARELQVRPSGGPTTELLVTAGYGADNLSASAVRNDYLITSLVTGFDENGVPQLSSLPEINADDSHRLTIRSLRDMGAGRAGFVIYLDECPLATGSATDKGLDGAALNAVAERYNRAGAVFPSLITAGDERDALTGMGISGSGVLEEIAITSQRPSFVDSTKYLTLTWDENVTEIAYRINGGAFVPLDVSARRQEIAFSSAFPNSMELTVVFAEPYKFNPSACTTSGCTIDESKEILFDARMPAAKLNVNAFSGICEVDGVAYEKVDQAVTKAIESGTPSQPSTLKLMADVTLEDGLNFAPPMNVSRVILDLNGKTISTSDEGDTTITAGGVVQLVITNSAAVQANITGKGEDAVSLEMKDWSLVEICGDILFSRRVDTTITEDWREGGADPYWTLELKGGTYHGYPTEPFYLAKYVDSNYEAVEDGPDYVRVQKKPALTAKPRLSERYHVPTVAEVAAETGYTTADARNLAGEDSTDSERTAALRKAARWATAYQVNATDVAAMAAEENELLADAYLLDCEPTADAVAAAKAEFAGTIEVSESGEVAVGVAGRTEKDSQTDSSYGNGRLIRYGATTLENGGDWEVDKSGAIYFRYELVR